MKTFEFKNAFSIEADGFEFQNEDVKRELFNVLFDGDGYAVIRGFPIDDSSLEKSERDVLNFSFLLGVPVSQNTDNEFICRVEDLKGKVGAKPRGYQHAQALPYHSDRCDLLLLCGVNPAPVGGETIVMSGKKLQAEVRSDYPTIYNVLKTPFPFDMRIAGFGDNASWYRVPVFSEMENQNTLLWYCRGYIEDSQKHADCPKLTEDQVEALDVMSTIINASQSGEQINLQRGEILIMNSTTTIHARNGYPEGSDRLLLRVWISNNNSELPDDFKNIFGNTTRGAYRGGVWSDRLNLSVIPKELPAAKKFVRNLGLAPGMTDYN